MSIQELQVWKQGAEAKIYLIDWTHRKVVAKHRFAKTWRIPELDTQIISKRTTQEAKALSKLVGHVNVPILYLVDVKTWTIYMEHFAAPRVVDVIPNIETDDELKALGKMIGRDLAIMHNMDLIHGDITTCNLLLRGSDLIWIDFGSSLISTLVEDKAVDLFLLEKALLSTHSLVTKVIFDAVCSIYLHSAGSGKSVLQKVEIVRQRGRKRTNLG